MSKSFLKTSVYIVGLAWSSIVCAAGLGGINVTSALGQPLKAEIELVSVEKLDKTSLIAKMASVDAFKSAGVDYPYGLPKLKFQIEDRANGESYVKVTSSQPVNEPFVSLLVELSWSSGKLLREYTFLLDPVDYQPEQPKAAEVKPIAPVLASPVVVPPATTEPVVAQPLVEAPSAASAVVPVAETTPAPVAATESAPVELVPVAQSAVAATQPAVETPEATAPLTTAIPAEPAPLTQDALSKEEAIAEPIMTKRGDTLSKIALQNKAADVSLERMLVALYRANAEVFDGKNMNRLKTGKILRLPDASEVEGVKQAEAVKEIRAQVADWNAYREKLAAARSAASEHADKQESAGKVTTAVMDKAPADKAPAKEVLKLSKGEAPNDKAVGGGKATAQDKANAKEEEAIAKNKALKEAQERTAILEKNVKDMQRLADLKKQPAAEAKPAVSAPAAAVTLSGAASAVAAASGVDAAKPKVKPAQPKVVPPQPSMIDDMLSDPMYLAGGAAVLLLLGGAGFVVARRGKQGGGAKKKDAPAKKKEKVEDAANAPGRIAAPVAPSPDTGDFTHSAEPTADSADAEEVDPIGEADLFLTFGRDTQAEEVLKEALKKNPNNIPVKLKLLSIYVSRKDTNSFYTYAREIKESGDESAWAQTAAMGLELEPNNPFYGGEASATPAAEAMSEAAAPSVDFDLGFDASAPTNPEFGSQNTIVLEAPAPAQEKTAIMSSEELRAASEETPMDFDVTGTHPGLKAMEASAAKPEDSSALNMDDLVFDVTATHPKMPAPEAVSAAPTAADDGLAFTLDFPSDFNKPQETSAKSAPAVQDIGLGEISLNLDGLGASAGSAAPKGEHWHEVATKLDLAKAYQEMGDAAGAREILEEVVRDGDEQQRETAQTLLQQL